MTMSRTGTTVTKTTCCYCGVGCGIAVTRDSRGRLSLRGDEEHPVNHGMLCSKGRTLLHVVAARTDRLLHPQVRLDRGFAPRRTTWDLALAHVAAEFSRLISTYGPDSVAFYGSGQLLTEEYYVLNKLVKGFIGTNNLDTNSRLCMSSAVAGYKQTLGQDGPPTSYADIAECDTILVSGGNPAWCHPILWRQVEARKQADPTVKIIVIDPRRTATVASADLHLKLLPGTDVHLHYGLGRQLIALGAIDHGYLAAHVDGYAAWAAACEPWTLDATAAACGLNAADIAQAAEWLAGDRRFLSMWTMGLNQSSVGVDKNTTLIALSLVTGKIGKPGCGPFSLTGQPNAMGGREVGGMANLASNHRDLANPADRAEIANAWGVESVPSKPGLTAVELFRAVKSGQVKAVWIIATNPIESLPDAQLVQEALQAAELVVVQDCYPTATSEHAHVILPAATWLEKSGTMTNSERRIMLLQPAATAPGEAMPDAEIICRFAAAMGHGQAFAYKDSGEIFAEHAKLSTGRDCDISGASWARLRQGSLQWPVPATDHPGTPRLYGDGRFHTPSGKAQLRAPAIAWRTEAVSPEFPLILTTGRLRDQWHTMTKTGRVQKLNAHAPTPFCEIHPADAQARGIADGAVMQVRTARGEIRLAAKVTTDIRQGTVFVPMHWGRLLGGESGWLNRTTNPTFDPVSKEPDLKFSACAVAAVVPPTRHIVVIGGGAATWGFLEHHLAAGLSDTIQVFGDEPQPFYDRVQLPHLVDGSKLWEQIIKGDARSLAERSSGRFRFAPGVAITAIDRKAREVVDATGARHGYDVLVLATGCRAAKHYQGHLPKAGVHFLRRRGDADAIRGRAGPGKRALIVGGGLLGLELADALAEIGTAVTVLQRGDRLMGRQLDATAGDLLAGALAERGITVRFQSQLDELIGGDEVTGARLVGGTVLPVDLVVFATGTAPNAELARQALITCSTGVVVDQFLRTSDPQVYAIGEVADFHGKNAATTAAAERQAWHLVEHLRGNPHAPYPGAVNSNILKVHGVKLASVGETDPDPGTAQVLVFSDPDAGIYQKAVVRDDRLIGVLLFGDTSQFSTWRELVANGTELEEVRATLLRGGATRPVEGRLVCSCNQVGEGTLQREIAGGCRDLAALCTKTGAGTSCGSCRPEVATLIARQANPEGPATFAEARSTTEQQLL
jgi:ferredoxin-nitrate reductase